MNVTDSPFLNPKLSGTCHEIREAVRNLCSYYPDEYWRKIDEGRGFPEEFVDALTSANARQESRGAHVRDDALNTPETPNSRDDRNWLKHSLWYKENKRLAYKPVRLKPLSGESITPKTRTY